MTEREYYSDFSKVQKYGDGKAKVKIRWLTWKGREWIDLRLFRRTDDGYVHTLKGVRFTPDQLRKVIPALSEMLEHIDDHIEEKKREAQETMEE